RVADLADARERPEARDEPVALGRVVDGDLDRSSELAPRVLRRVRFEDPGLGLHDLRQGPEPDAVAVREAPALAPSDQVGLRIQVLRELLDQPALANARLAQ